MFLFFFEFLFLFYFRLFSLNRLTRAKATNDFYGTHGDLDKYPRGTRPLKSHTTLDDLDLVVTYCSQADWTLSITIPRKQFTTRSSNTEFIGGIITLQQELNRKGQRNPWHQKFLIATRAALDKATKNTFGELNKEEKWRELGVDAPPTKDTRRITLQE